MNIFLRHPGKNYVFEVRINISPIGMKSKNVQVYDGIFLYFSACNPLNNDLKPIEKGDIMVTFMAYYCTW